LDIADGVEIEVIRDAVLDHLDQGRGYLFRCIPFNKIEVGAGLGAAKFRHLSLTDEVCAGDDLAAGRLPKHFGQADDGDYLG